MKTSLRGATLCALFAMHLVPNVVWPQPPRRQTRVEFRWADTTPSKRTTEATLPDGVQKVYLEGRTVISNTDVVAARAVRDPRRLDVEAYQVEVRFRQGAAKRIEEGRSRPGRRGIAIILDGKVFSLLLLQATQYEQVIVYGLTKEDAELLARALGHRPHNR
jgi:hypothetical protein